MPVSTAVQVPAPAHLPAAPDDLSAAVPRETDAHAIHRSRLATTDATPKRAKPVEAHAVSTKRQRVAKGAPLRDGSSVGRAEKVSARTSAKAGHHPRTRGTVSAATVNGARSQTSRRTGHAAQAAARHPAASTERHVRGARAARVAHAKAKGPSKVGGKRHPASATQASVKGARGKPVPVGVRRHRAQA